MSYDWMNKKYEICYRIKNAVHEFVQCMGTNVKPIVFITFDLMQELKETAELYYTCYEGENPEPVVCGCPARVIGGVDQLYVGFEI